MKTTKKKTYTEFELGSMFSKKEEVETARQILSKYLADYEIEGLADRNLLRQLIYIEVVNTRLQNTLNTFTTEENTPPPQLIDSLHKNISKIIEIREKLGLNKGREKEGDYSVIKKLQKKFEVWRQNNGASRTAICPHCAKMILFKMRVEQFEASKHPFFKDRWIFNEALWKLFKENKLSKKDVADVLQVSEDYIDYIENKVLAVKETTEAPVQQ